MSKDSPKLLVADKNGNVFDVPFMGAVGMKAGTYYRLTAKDLVPLPEDSEFFMLPDRKPVGWDMSSGGFIEAGKELFPGSKGPCYPVAAFLAPGYTTSHNTAYTEGQGAAQLPLFSYAAAAFYKGSFYAAGVLVDREKRQRLSGMDPEDVEKGVELFRKILPANRLARHLESCALCYGCPAAKNFFLKRYECPLPTSPACNARCVGCISLQKDGSCPVTQPRIKFTPSPEEIAEVALLHIGEVKDPVVSFGQGCEGEPLMAGDTLVKAVRLIRKRTGKGVINLNTNASRPEYISRLFDEGLDSIRVSMNSFRSRYYMAYYRPRGYDLSDVLSSIRNAKKRKGFVSVNYLVMPGFTDAPEEYDGLCSFIEGMEVDMVQWRNLNYDPRRYFSRIKAPFGEAGAMGIGNVIRGAHERFPGLMKGYFNPSLARMRRAGKKIKT